MQFVSKSKASLTKYPNQKMANIIDISGEAKNLDCAFWIGRAKNYATGKNPPPNLIVYCESLYEIPDSGSWMKKLLPNKDMPIETFISRFLLQKNLQNLLQVQKLRSGRKKVAISDNEEDYTLIFNFSNNLE